MVNLYQNKLPIYEIMSGASIAFAALLLIVPGFFTDFIGFLLLIPFTRKIIFSVLLKNKSKIKSSNDLFNIQTMGFRGEAMSSIAAIAHVVVKSKLIENKLGTYIAIEGGKVIKHEDCSSTNGTSIKVKNLFYNVPGRRNFLKSDKVEMRHIIEEYTRIALANPEVKMQLYHNKKEIIHCPKSNFRKRIVNLIGENKNDKKGRRKWLK